MRTRVLAACLLVSGCTAPAFKNFTSGNFGPSTTGEETSSTSSTSSTGGGWWSGGIETSTVASGDDVSSESGSSGTGTGTDSSGSTTGGSAGSTTTGAGSTGTSGKSPFCGDGVVEGEEECDDGDIDFDDGCNQVCARDRTVFITADVFLPFQLGGADSADDICKQAAGLAGLANHASYTAWLSDSTSDAAARIFVGRGRYVRPDGAVVADDLVKLLIGPLQQPINVTEYGEVALGGAWTGTQPDGTLAPGLSHCQDWTVNGPAEWTVRGAPAATDGRWTQMPELAPCLDEKRIYCFEGK